MGLYILRFSVGLRYVFAGNKDLPRGKGILIICPFFRPNIGGAETHLDDLCEYLRQHDFMVYVLTYQPLTTRVRGLSVERQKNLEIRRFNWIGFNLFNILEPYPLLEILYLTPVLFIHSLLFVWRRRKNIDVINAHGLNAAFVAAVCKKIYKKRVVVNIHAIYNLSRRYFLRTIIKSVLGVADSVLCLGEKSRDEFVKSGLKSEKVSAYRQWVKQDLIFKPRDKNKSRAQLGLSGEFIALFTGRFIERKGIRVLINAAASFPAGVKFIFVGDGPLKAEVERAASTYKNVIYMGRKSQEELPVLYSASDVIIIPSQYEEGFARVVLEGLSCGRPLIAANKGCLKEMLNSSVALLIEPTPQDIVNSIQALINDRKRLEVLTANCRNYALRYFSEKNAETIVGRFYENNPYQSS